MSRTAKAVVCRELNAPVQVEEIQVDPPKGGEVTIKLEPGSGAAEARRAGDPDLQH